MNSGSSRETEDYYGFGPGPSASGRETRKMRRTELSRQKKSNFSGKSVSSERDSNLSNNAKSRQIHHISPSILKHDILSSLKDQSSKYCQNNFPSSTDLQSNASPSIRKSRLQISTGVVGIKMGSLSPNTVLSHPSKVLIVNESSSGRNGSKSKKQKSIVYVEYNNFMTELNNNKLGKKSQEKDFMPYEQNIHIQSSTNLHSNSPLKKKTGQEFSNLMSSNLDNEYFFGMNRNCMSPILGVLDKKEGQKGLLGLMKIGSEIRQMSAKEIQSPRNEGSKLKLSRNGMKNGQANKNQTSIANLSITSTSKNKFQSSKLVSISPKLLKTEQNRADHKHFKSKISMHDIVALKGKNHQQNSKLNSPTRESRGSVKSNRSTKFENYGIQVNIAENVFPRNKKSQENSEIKKEYLIKPKQNQNLISQKTIKYSDSSNQKQQKQLTLLKSKSSDESHKIQAGYSQLNNPYNLTKNEDLISNYQKKKQSQIHDLVSEIRGKSQKENFQVQGLSQVNQLNKQITKAKQKIFSSEDSQSIISNSSSRRERKLMKTDGNDLKSSNLKMSIKSTSQSKLKMPPSPKASRKHIFEPKTPQPYSNYKQQSSQENQGHKSSQNQEKSPIGFEKNLNPIRDIEPKVSKEPINIQQSKRQKQIDEYDSVYYTPNPYNFKHSIQVSPSKNSNFVSQNEKSSIVSYLESDPSIVEQCDLQSHISSMQSNDEKLSTINVKNQNVSSSCKLRREQIAQKSKIRASRNSLKSNQSRHSKKIMINPGSKKESSFKNSIYSEKSQQSQSFVDESRCSQKVENEHHNSKSSRVANNMEHSVEYKNLDAQKKESTQQVKSKSIPDQGIKFLKVVKVNKSVKIASNSSLHLIKDEVSENKLLNPQKQHSEVKDSSIVSQNQPSIELNQNQQSNQIPNNLHSNVGSVHMMNQNDSKNLSKIQLKNQQQNDYSEEEQSHTSFEEQSSMQENDQKKQFFVQHIESQIKQLPQESPDQNKLSNILHTNTKKPLQIPNENSLKKQEIPQRKQSHKQSQSDLQNSAYSIQSLKRSGKRQGTKNPIQGANIPSQRSQMIFSKQDRSSISIKSGRNLKPLNLENPSIQDFLTYVDEYDIAIGFLYLYVEDTMTFYCTEEDVQGSPKAQQFVTRMRILKSKKYEEKYEKLSFLVMKKYLYQKNRIVKCLRGLYPNIFNLTGLEIPQKILKKFINHEQTKEKLKQFEAETKELFKELEEKYRFLRLKSENKKNKLIKLQTPYDNFARDIVGMLVEELNQITADIDEMEIETGSKLSSSNPSFPFGTKQGAHSVTSLIAKEILSSEQRGIEIMEIVFLFSELNGRKVKKCELLNISQIDFEVFYEWHIDSLLATYEYFEGLRYPPDEAAKKGK